MLLFVVQIIALWSTATFGVLGSECTDTCDGSFNLGIPVTMCGTDLKTHETTFDALCTTSSCYKDTCGVMTYYPGRCGCPNNCFEQFQHGACTTDGSDKEVCSCSTGWTGKDCSLVAEGNICSYNGQLVLSDDKNAAFPFAYCECDDGWTGVDCSTPVFSAGYLPWGEGIFDGHDAYTSKDDYGDDHPVWNTSLIATIRIELPEESFLSLLYPQNSLNQTYVPATVHFDNGYVQQTLTDVGFKQKGSGCRKHQKHCWNVKFNEFVSGQKLVGMKKLGIKGGTDDDDVLAKYMMYVDMLRATVAPTQRTSHTLLYINDVFYGLNLMHEDIDEGFIEGRIDGDDGEGNLYKFDGGVYLQYIDSEVETYQNISNIEQAEGNGDWSDYVQLMEFLNQTSDEDFEEQLESRVDVDGLMRLMIVESFLMDTDGMARNGRNYNVYNLRDGTHPDRWTLFNYDFDMSLEFNLYTQQPYMGERYLNIFTFFQRELGVDDDYNPLVNRVLAIPKYNATYVKMYQQFLEATFGSASPMQPTVLHGQRMQFVLPWVERDLLWQLSNGLNSSQFVAYGEYTIDLLRERYYNITDQLNSASEELGL